MAGPFVRSLEARETTVNDVKAPLLRKVAVSFSAAYPLIWYCVQENLEPGKRRMAPVRVRVRVKVLGPAVKTLRGGATSQRWVECQIMDDRHVTQS